MAEIKNNENITASLSSVENLSAEVQSKEEILKGKIANSILYFKGENGKSPYIGSNGNWFIYDDEKKEWIDTTVNAINGTIDLSKYYTKTETDNKIKEVSDWINEQINKFYTKEEIDKKFEDLDIGTGGEIDISGKEDKSNKVRQVEEKDLDTLTMEQYLSAAASAHLIRGLRNAIDEKSDLSKEDIEEILSDTFDEINQNINKKADSADSLEGYGIKDAYTKEEVDSKENILKGSIKNLQDEDVALAADIKKVEDKAGNLEKELITANSSIVNLTNDLNKVNSNVEDLSSELEKSNIAIEENKESAETALTIAKGRATGYVFDTVADLDSWLSKKENTDNLVAGDNFYIKAIDVPDYWWDGVEKQQLETQKVDLTEYVKNTDYATSTTAGVVKGAGNYGTAVRPDGSLALQAASVGEIETKKSYYKPITPYRADKTVRQSTHQDLSNSYDVNSLTVSAEFIEEKGTLPVSYNAVKQYVDNSSIEIVDDLISSDTDKALSANQGKILNEKSKTLQQDISDLQANIVGKEEKTNRVSSGLGLFGNDFHEDVSDDKYPTTKLAHEWAMEGYNLGSVANQRLDENYYTKTQVDAAIQSAIGIVLGGAS